MDILKFEEEKKKVEKKKEKLILQERLLKARQKKMQAKRFAKIGELAKKANIAELEDEVLLGAFLEILKKRDSEENLMGWREAALKFSRAKKNSRNALIVSFRTAPGKEVADSLKNLKFTFNKFRNEYYGYASKKELEEALLGSDYKIEVVED